MAQPTHCGINPIHGDLPQRERGREHHQKHEQEDGEAQHPMGHKFVEQVGGLIRVLHLSHAIFHLFQRPMNKAILGIHDGRLAIDSSLFQHALRGHINNLFNRFEIALRRQHRRGVSIFL